MTDITAASIENFIPFYPDIADPDFTYQISRKKEFNELYLEPSEPIPETGDLLQTQIFMKRFFAPETPYTEALLFHGLGSGKTCVASAISENYKNTEVGGRPRYRALILVKNEDLVRNVIQEIATRCTKDIYTPRPTAAEIRKGVVMTEAARVARVNRMIAQSYEIIPIETFLKNLPSDEVIKRKYTGPVIVDEAHALRIQPSRKKKKKGLEAIIEEQTEEEFVEELQESPEPGKKKKPLEDSAMLYQKMHHFLHLVPGRKLLLTGTPIWDKPSEIASLTNLILPLDQQIVTGTAFDAKFFDEDGRLDEEAAQELREKFKGRVSYLRQMMTTAERIEMGTTEPWLQHVTVFPNGMSETQAAIAREAREAIESKTIKVKGKMVEREVKGGTVLKLARDAMNMVIPTFDAEGRVIGAEYGPEAFKKYIVKEVKKRTARGETIVKTYSIDPRTQPYLRREIKDNLREWGIKFASIIEDIKSHPDEVTFIYNEEVTGPGGAIMLGLCLQIHGLIWAKTASDIARSSGTRKRFAVITSDPQTTSQAKQIQDLIGSSNNDATYRELESNAHGERLQVIIGSEKIALGLSIKNVRRVHIAMPHWNIPSIDQAQARGFRFGSHEALPPNERVVHIFRHVAVEQPDDGEEGFDQGLGFPPEASFTDYETTDVYIYKIAEEKEYKNTQIYRLIKEEAFDCAAFYHRNVLETDVEMTRECDYRECNYECDGFPPMSKKDKVWDYTIPEDQLDYSTYNLFYSSGKLREYIDAIVKLFNNYFSLFVDTAQQLLGISERELFLHAVDIIINSRTLIRNRYGFASYLKESGNILFLDNSISAKSAYAESTYIENPLVTELTSLDALVEILELEQDRENVLKFCKAPTITLFDQLSYKTRILLLEAAYINNLGTENKRQKASSQIILKALGDNIRQMSDGTAVHILYDEEFKGQAFNIAAKDIKVTGMMRKYDTETGQWTYVESREQEEIYVNEIRTEMSGQREMGFEDNPYGVFGWISKKDGSFRINIKKKGKVRGKKCENFDKPDLVDIFVERLKYFPDPRQEYLDLDRIELMKNIRGTPGFSKIKETLEDYDDQQLRGLLTLLTYHIEELCQTMMEWFKENDLLYSK